MESNRQYTTQPSNFTQKLSKGQRRRRNHHIRKQQVALEQSETLRNVVRQQLQEVNREEWLGKSNKNIYFYNNLNF